MKQSHDYIWSVRRNIQIGITKAEAWEIISSKNHLENFHPFCKVNKVINWSNSNHKDSIEYYGGRTLVRKFYNWLEGQGYDLVIGDSSGNDSQVSWRIKDHEGGCVVSISIKPYIYNKGSKLLNFFPFFFFVKPKLSNYLASVLSGLKYYSEKKKIVQANQFGNHPWFS